MNIDLGPTRVWFTEHSGPDFDLFTEVLEERPYALDLTGSSSYRYPPRLPTPYHTLHILRHIHQGQQTVRQSPIDSDISLSLGDRRG